MTSKVLNFLWLNLDIPAPPDPADGTIREPLPAKYIANTRKAGEAHPDAEIDLWVDSKRLTKKQMDYLKTSLEEGMMNVHLKDLRSIPAYAKEKLYNKAETNPNWRDGGQRALIWRQVDAAKILVSLQGNFDQTFFADLDHAHLDIDSKEVQGMIKKHGLMIGSSSGWSASVENQLWGFDRSRRKFFKNYYRSALAGAYLGLNAWMNLVVRVRLQLQAKKKPLLGGEGIPLEEICLLISGDGSQAEQPGHQWKNGWSQQAAPSSIPVDKIAGSFNEHSEKSSNAVPNLPAAQSAAVRRSSPAVMGFK